MKRRSRRTAGAIASYHAAFGRGPIAALRRVGIVRTRYAFQCSGCGWLSRRYPKVKTHECPVGRAIRRRNERATRKRSGVILP